MIQLTKEFTTDERDEDVVSIALALSGEADELWRRSFTERITDSDWLGANDGVILGFSFPFSYDGENKIEIRTHHSTIEQSLAAVSMTIDKVNDERIEAVTHNPKTPGDAHLKVQAWFDQS